MHIIKCQVCGVILNEGIRRCPRCGALVKRERDPRGGWLGRLLLKPLWALSLALMVVLGVLLIYQAQRPTLPAPAEGRAAAEPPAEDVWIWTILQQKFPQLRVTWQDARGVSYVAVPETFWKSMLARERVRFAEELDQLFDQQRWAIITGRYWGGPQIMLETLHPREDLLDSPRASSPVVAAVPPPARPAKPKPPAPASSGPSPSAPAGSSLQRPAASGLPAYEVLFAIDAFLTNRRYGEILVPSLSADTPVDERRRIAREIAEREQLDDLTLYRTREAREAHYSMEFADQHPQALDQGLLGFWERGRFKPHRPGR